MKAMILAAGLGTRLRPLTNTVPKPMMPLCNRPLIAWLIDALVEAGVHDVVVNLHHLPETIESALPPLFPSVHFTFSYEPQILGTGGALRKVRAQLESETEFFLLNGDTWQRPPLEALRRARQERAAVAALTLRHPPREDRFTAVWEENGVVTGFGNGRGEPLMFSGSHCIASRIFDCLPDRDVFGIVDSVYQSLLQQDEPIIAVVDDGPWFDIGTPRRYLQASAALCGGSTIGANSVVDGVVKDSILWNDCFIGDGVELESCIVAAGVELRRPVRLRERVVCRTDPAMPIEPEWKVEDGLLFVPI